MISYKKLYEETRHLSLLLVEDFEPLRQEMHSLCEDLFAKVTSAVNGEEAWYLYTKEQHDAKGFDLVVSDIQMPKMDGVMLSRKIRQENEAQPIIILSAYSESKYLIELINIGISAFVRKPIEHDQLFEIMYEQSIKINQNKERIKQENSVILGAGYKWEKDTQTLKKNDNIVVLTKHELLLLSLLITKQEYVCTTSEIIEMFFSYGIDMGEKNIRNLVFKLRKKIPEQWIESVYGLGYRFSVQALADTL